MLGTLRVWRADFGNDQELDVEMGIRNKCAAISERLALTRVLETAPRRSCLIVLNYHRLGQPNGQPYDDGTFSATAYEFESQVEFLKRRYSIVTLDEAIQLVTGKQTFRGAAVLLTFDDGYLDNFQIAYPILRSLGVQGSFFLISSFVGSNELPWWDRIAYGVKRARNRVIALDYPNRMQFDLTQQDPADVIRVILAQYKKLPSRSDAARFLAHLERACEPEPRTTAERLFLNWSEAAEMRANGMAIGCHTHTHPILSQLTVEEQYDELRTVKETIQARLSIPANVLAYPVGKKTTFTPQTEEVLQQLGYTAAFSYYGGINLPGNTRPFDVRRNSVDAGLPLCRLRLQLAVASVTGSQWF